jgi:hypothetical protein
MPWIPRFSLRTAAVLLTLLVIAIGLAASWHHRARDQQQAMAAVQAAGGWVDVEQSTRRDWLRDRLGPEYFDRVTFASLPGEYHWIRRLPYLQSVELTGDFDAIDVGHLAASRTLSDVSFRTTDVSVAVLRELSSMPQLRGLDLGGRHLSPAHIQALRKLPQITELSLASTGVSDESIPRLATLQRLVSLNLAGCPIEGSGFAALQVGRDFPRLVALDLSGTRLTESGVANVARMTRIERLGLQNLDLSGLSARSLANLTTLSFLNIRGTKINAANLASLSRIASLTSMELTVPLDNREFEDSVHSLQGVRHMSFDVNEVHVPFIDRLFDKRPEVVVTIDGVDFDRARWESTKDRETQLMKQRIRSLTQWRRLRVEQYGVGASR